MNAKSSIKNPEFSSSEKAQMILRFADDIKAERIELLDVRKKTSIADFFVICTGNSDTHVRAISEKVAEKMREHKVKPVRAIEGHPSSGWVLLDYGDVVLHVMLEDKRQFYDLESLWQTLSNDPNLLDT